MNQDVHSPQNCLLLKVQESLSLYAQSGHDLHAAEHGRMRKVLGSYLGVFGWCLGLEGGAHVDNVLHFNERACGCVLWKLSLEGCKLNYLSLTGPVNGMTLVFVSSPQLQSLLVIWWDPSFVPWCADEIQNINQLKTSHQGLVLQMCQTLEQSCAGDATAS